MFKPTFFDDNDPNNPKRKTYIERKAVLKIIYDIKENKEIPKNYGTLLDIIRSIRNLPTADVVEVRRGEWIKRTEHLYKCSLCGNSAFISLGGIPCNYCPECGAKMDGKEGANSG